MKIAPFCHLYVVFIRQISQIARYLQRYWIPVDISVDIFNLPSPFLFNKVEFSVMIVLLSKVLYSLNPKGAIDPT